MAADTQAVTPVIHADGPGECVFSPRSIPLRRVSRVAVPNISFLASNHRSRRAAAMHLLDAPRTYIASTAADLGRDGQRVRS